MSTHQDAKERCAMENYGGDATASYFKRSIKVRKQRHRDKIKMALRQSKMALRQSELQTSEKEHDSCPPSCGVCAKTCAFTGGLNLKIVEEGVKVGVLRVRCLKVDAKALAKAKEQARAKAKAKAKVKERANLMAKLADAKKKKEAKLADAKKTEEAEMMLDLDWVDDERNQYLLEPNLTWEQKVVNILQMVRCRELTEYNHKLGFSAPTRFCAFNIAFFDLDKESEGVPWKPIHKIPSPRNQWLADSVNVIAIKVAKSDKDYPISVFGTVLARDEYDYRCVYLFKRGRDDPQVITSKDDTLTLMGPYRALAVSDNMYFEFHLKVKGDGDVDQDFSKGLLVHSAVCRMRQPTTKLLHSCLSTVELVYTPVPYAVEASFAISILKGPSDFIRKVTAWTSGNEENKILVYNKEVDGVGRGESVHGLVAVPEHEELVLRICVFEHCEHERGKCFQLALGHDINECLAGQEPYELQVKISWRGVMILRGPSLWGRPNMWWRLGDDLLLL